MPSRRYTIFRTNDDQNQWRHLASLFLHYVTLQIHVRFDITYYCVTEYKNKRKGHKLIQEVCLRYQLSRKNNDKYLSKATNYDKKRVPIMPFARKELTKEQSFYNVGRIKMKHCDKTLWFLNACNTTKDYPTTYCTVRCRKIWSVFSKRHGNHHFRQGRPRRKYRQTYKAHQIQKLKYLWSRLAVVLVQSIEARC